MNTKIALVAEQPSTVQYWITPKEDTPYLRAKEYLQQDGTRGAVTFKVKSQTHQRCSEGTNKILCAPEPSEKNPGKEAVTSTRDRARPAFEYLSVSYGSMGQQWPAAGIGALAEAVGFNSTWTENSQMFKLDLEKSGNQRSNCQPPLDHRNSKRIPEKHLLLLHWLC